MARSTPALAGQAAYPNEKWVDIQQQVTSALFSTFNTTPGLTPSIVPTALGQKYLSVVQNITGGTRPMFDQGVAYGQAFPSAYGTFVADTTTPRARPR